MNNPADDDLVIGLVCRVDELKIGDLIRTPAHMWEMVTSLEAGGEFSRSTRVATDETGPEHPREWVNHHRLIVQRKCPASTPAPVIALNIPRPAAPIEAGMVAALSPAA